MRNITRATGMLIATLTLASAAYAQSGKPSFESLDKNADGKISLDEASADPALFTAFKTLDTNKDGYLSKEEFSAFKPAS
jgi:Ca2+-binding EF-hand superfamily protein